jgi:ABC-2 type transport system ATP-binding protein
MEALSLNISQLKKQYPESDKPAIDGLNLSIPKGQIHGLIGPNGAGKTTTISIIAGILAFNSGNITIEGFDYKSHRKAIVKRIGYVPQDMALYTDLSAEENLKFFGKLHAIPSKELKKQIETLLKRMGLYEKRKQAVKYYSGGMKRRINLIIGLLHQPSFLILDEPTVGIDIQSKQVILDYLLELKTSGTTILYTSHMLEEAEKICDYISIMDHGKLIEEGQPTELKAKYQLDRLEDIFIKLTGKSLRD